MSRLLNGLRWAVGSVLLFGSLLLGIVGFVFSDGFGEDDDEYGAKIEMVSTAMGAGLTYQEECSACHIAYPAQLLPARSWTKLMSQLDNHFGENAELMPVMQSDIEGYLVSHAADTSQTRLGKKALRGLKASATPLRITELPFYTRKHDEIPDKYVTGNPDVGSFSQCQACHGQASERGVFDEDTVDIPGVGRWDD